MKANESKLIKPEVWAAQVGYQAVMSRQEWLDTLVWFHHLMGPGHYHSTESKFGIHPRAEGAEHRRCPQTLC